MPTADLIGRYETIVPSIDRQLAMDAFDALPSGHPMIGLLELDVTEALARIAEMRRRGERVSLFSFVLRCIAVAIAEHPDMNLVRHGRRLVRFDDVDVSVPVEVQTDHGKFPREVVVRRAQDMSASQIFAVLEEAQSRHAKSGELGAEDRWVRRLTRAVRWLPRFLRIALVRLIVRDAFRIKARAGTTLVTSVGKFAAIPGHSFTFTTGPRAAAFVVGSAVDKPWAHEGRVAVRSVLSLSIVVDHDLVDGAPVARFATRLSALVEGAEGLAPGLQPTARTLAAASAPDSP
jgi:pyruvate/2-oxoglutarate dehydrogenase complex dihydrolipoamide acyltransferase (E2) component